MPEIENKPQNYTTDPSTSKPDSRLHTFINDMYQLQQIYSVQPLEYTDIVGEYWQRINDIIYALGLTQKQSTVTHIGWTVPIIGKKRSDLVTETLGGYDNEGNPIDYPDSPGNSINEYNLDNNKQAPDSHLTTAYGTGKTEAHRYGLIQTIDWMFQRNINTWGDLYDFFYNNLNSGIHPTSLKDMMFGSSTTLIDIQNIFDDITRFLGNGNKGIANSIQYLINNIIGGDFVDWLNDENKKCITESYEYKYNIYKSSANGRFPTNPNYSEIDYQGEYVDKLPETLNKKSFIIYRITIDEHNNPIKFQWNVYVNNTDSDILLKDNSQYTISSNKFTIPSGKVNAGTYTIKDDIIVDGALYTINTLTKVFTIPSGSVNAGTYTVTTNLNNTPVVNNGGIDYIIDKNNQFTINDIVYTVIDNEYVTDKNVYSLVDNNAVIGNNYTKSYINISSNKVTHINTQNIESNNLPGNFISGIYDDVASYSSTRGIKANDIIVCKKKIVTKKSGPFSLEDILFGENNDFCTLFSSLNQDGMLSELIYIRDSIGEDLLDWFNEDNICTFDGVVRSGSNVTESYKSGPHNLKELLFDETDLSEICDLIKNLKSKGIVNEITNIVNYLGDNYFNYVYNIIYGPDNPDSPSSPDGPFDPNTNPLWVLEHMDIGQVLYGNKNEHNKVTYENDWINKEGFICENEFEVNMCKSDTVDQQKIFNKFNRYSHAGTTNKVSETGIISGPERNDIVFLNKNDCLNTTPTETITKNCIRLTNSYAPAFSWYQYGSSIDKFYVLSDDFKSVLSLGTAFYFNLTYFKHIKHFTIAPYTYIVFSYYNPFIKTFKISGNVTYTLNNYAKTVVSSAMAEDDDPITIRNDKFTIGSTEYTIAYQNGVIKNLTYDTGTINFENGGYDPNFNLVIRYNTAVNGNNVSFHITNKLYNISSTTVKTFNALDYTFDKSDNHYFVCSTDNSNTQEFTVYYYYWDFMNYIENLQKNYSMNAKQFSLILPNSNAIIPDAIKNSSIDITNISKASIGEMNCWELDSEDNSIKLGFNTTTYASLVSDRKFNEFSFECMPCSNNDDDDMIGIIISSYTDLKTGITHNIGIARSSAYLNILYNGTTTVIGTWNASDNSIPLKVLPFTAQSNYDTVTNINGTDIYYKKTSTGDKTELNNRIKTNYSDFDRNNFFKHNGPSSNGITDSINNGIIYTDESTGEEINGVNKYCNIPKTLRFFVNSLKKHSLLKAYRYNNLNTNSYDIISATPAGGSAIGVKINANGKHYFEYGGKTYTFTILTKVTDGTNTYEVDENKFTINDVVYTIGYKNDLANNVISAITVTVGKTIYELNSSNKFIVPNDNGNITYTISNSTTVNDGTTTITVSNDKFTANNVTFTLNTVRKVLVGLYAKINELTIPQLKSIEYSLGPTIISISPFSGHIGGVPSINRCFINAYGLLNCAGPAYIKNANCFYKVDRVKDEDTGYYKLNVKFKDIYTTNSAANYKDIEITVNNNGNLKVVAGGKTFTINDSNNIFKEMFSSATSYGYVAQSEPLSEFREIKFVNKSGDKIYDVANAKVYILKDGEFIEDNSSAQDVLARIVNDFSWGRYITNTSTNKTFYTSYDQKKLIKISDAVIENPDEPKYINSRIRVNRDKGLFYNGNNELDLDFVNASTSNSLYLNNPGGILQFTGASGINRISIQRTDTDGIMSITAGTENGPSTGSQLSLFGKDVENTGGYFRLFAADGNSTKKLEGRPDGLLSWNGYINITGNATIAGTSNLGTTNIGTSSANKNLTVNGNSTVSGTSNLGTTNIGTSTANKNLTVNGNTTITGTGTINGNTTIKGTLDLTKTTDASGTSDNSPALRIGSTTGAHLEFDGNEIMSKTNGTETAGLYINNDGGLVTIGSGGLKVNGTITGTLAKTMTVQINGTTLGNSYNNSANVTANIPTSTKTRLGVIKIGSGFSINSDGTLSVDFDQMPAEDYTKLIRSLNLTLYCNEYLTVGTDPDTGNLIKRKIPTDFYVDGRANGPGVDNNTDYDRGWSADKPWKTIQYAITQLMTYYNIKSLSVNLYIKGGTSSNPLVYDTTLSMGDQNRNTGYITLRPYNNEYITISKTINDSSSVISITGGKWELKDIKVVLTVDQQIGGKATNTTTLPSRNTAIPRVINVSDTNVTLNNVSTQVIDNSLPYAKQSNGYVYKNSALYNYQVRSIYIHDNAKVTLSNGGKYQFPSLDNRNCAIYAFYLDNSGILAGAKNDDWQKAEYLCSGSWSTFFNALQGSYYRTFGTSTYNPYFKPNGTIKGRRYSVSSGAFANVVKLSESELRGIPAGMTIHTYFPGAGYTKTNPLSNVTTTVSDSNESSGDNDTLCYIASSTYSWIG